MLVLAPVYLLFSVFFRNPIFMSNAQFRNPALSMVLFELKTFTNKLGGDAHNTKFDPQFVS